MYRAEGKNFAERDLIGYLCCREGVYLFEFLQIKPVWHDIENCDEATVKKMSFKENQGSGQNTDRGAGALGLLLLGLIIVATCRILYKHNCHRESTN